MAVYPAVVKQAIDRGQLLQVTRRVGIFEADGLTPWVESSGAERLIGGGVNISYGDNERRTMDVTLRNDDNILRSRPDGFWYDKVLKLYRGVKYSPEVVQPMVAVVDVNGGLANANLIMARLAQVGLKDTKYFGGTLNSSMFTDYDIIVSESGATSANNFPLLTDLFARGKNIITIGTGNATIPHLTGGTAVTTQQWGISQMSPAGPLSAGWGTEAVGSAASGTAFSGVASGALALARYTVGSVTNSITASIGFNGIGAKWFDLRLPALGSTNTKQLMANVVAFLKEEYGDWEMQIGEFVIDRIDTDHFPSEAKVTGRDYVKKVTNSKLENAITLSAGTSVETIVRSLGANAGITKFRLATMSEVTSSDMSFDRGTPRWDVMRQAATTAGYEMFFDNEGFLVTRKFLDPTLSPENYLFQTGASGNLSTIKRSVNDSRIYNHIVVYGDPPSGEGRMPYVGEAKNTSASSPTRIARIGDRYYSYASTFFTSQQQCQDYANRLLSVHSLESFEMGFEAINYPWLEAGEIAEVLDPKATVSDPTKYLIDSGSMPLDLGPMSLTGKRVVIV